AGVPGERDQAGPGYSRVARLAPAALPPARFELVERILLGRPDHQPALIRAERRLGVPCRQILHMATGLGIPDLAGIAVPRTGDHPSAVWADRRAIQSVFPQGATSSPGSRQIEEDHLPRGLRMKRQSLAIPALAAPVRPATGRQVDSAGRTESQAT